jgi:hypothetical protein
MAFSVNVHLNLSFIMLICDVVLSVTYLLDSLFLISDTRGRHFQGLGDWSNPSLRPLNLSIDIPVFVQFFSFSVTTMLESKIVWDVTVEDW